MTTFETGDTLQPSGTVQLSADRAPLRSTWLLHRREVGRLLQAYLAFVVVWTLVGFLLTRVVDDSRLPRSDAAAERWFVGRRTDALNDTSFVMSMLADTVVKIAATAAVGLALLIHFRRWKETLIVIVSLVLEAMTFITVTWIVDRPRPDVPRLDSSPVGSSFPSGHVAASVAYGAIVVVIFQHTRRRLPRMLAVIAVVLLTMAVAFARMYRGMHHPTDVVMGAMLGAAAVAATTIVISGAEHRRRHAVASPETSAP
jgi:undecaprenyl-diphosphatase